MIKRSTLFRVGCFSLVAICCSVPAMAWEHHSLVTEALVDSMPALAGLPPVEVVSLETFLLAIEEELVEILAAQEAWSRTNLGWYAPRPDELAFVATGDAATVRLRFFEAIRINPESRAALYLSRLVEDPNAERTGLDPAEVTLLPGSTELRQFRFEPLDPGDLVSPREVLITASHEPDYGLDVGLFEDNGTEFGLRYGFGEQAFGDPNLDYGSQAPFHMGFYHESWLVFLFAGFLKESYPEYRIHLYKTLAEAAFENGQDYWGWRFMGWGLHHVSDLAMPYHTTVLPGYSTFRMLLINLLDMLGCPKYVNNAVQLVSNRHGALERYQGIQFERLFREGVSAHPLIEALQSEGAAPAYSDDLLRKEIARRSNAMSRKMDKTLVKYMPARFVKDPSVEAGNEADFDQIVELVEAEHGQTAINALNTKLAEALALVGLYGRSYIEALLPE